MTGIAMPESTTAPKRPGGNVGRVGFGRVSRSEWTKFRSLRSTWWSLAVTAVLTIGLGLLASMDVAGDPGSRPSSLDIAVGSQFGVMFAQLAVLVLGALIMTGEYSTGMIRSSLTVVPARLPVLLAKAVVLSAVVFVTTTVTTLISFVVSNAVWASQGRHGSSLGDPGVATALLGVPLYLTVAAVFALAVGTLIRNTAAAVSVLAAVFLVVPIVAGGVAGLREAAPYLPSNAGAALSQHELSATTMAGWPGWFLFCGYALVLAVGASARLHRTDA